MGLFDRFKKTNSKEDDSYVNDSPSEYKYDLSISFFLHEFSEDQVRNKIGSIVSVLEDQMTILTVDHSIVVDEEDDNLLFAKIEFLGLAQFRFENEEELNGDLQKSFPLVSNNMGVGFWMKGGVFAQIAEILFQGNESAEQKDITFFNHETTKSYDVTLEKDARGNCRMADWF